MKPVDSKSQIDLEIVLLARFDSDADGYLTADEVMKATRVFLRRSEQPTEAEIGRLMDQVSVRHRKDKAGIKVQQFSKIWVAVLKKQEELSDKCTKIARELQNLETAMQQVVLEASNKNDLRLIQGAYKNFQQHQALGEEDYVGYRSMKQALYELFGRPLVDARKQLLSRFLQTITEMHRTRKNFLLADQASAWDLVAAQLTQQKKLSNIGKVAFNSLSPTGAKA